MQAQMQAQEHNIVYVDKFTRVTPLKALGSAYTGGEHGKLECYRGNREVGNFGISVHGSGTFVRGQLEGTITSYDYKDLYEVFQLDDDASADSWFSSYKKQTSHDELKNIDKNAKEVTVHAPLDFIIEGNDYDINTVFITYQVIRLTVEGKSKDYVVTNNASAGAVTPSGDQYPGKFQPV